MMVGGFLTNHHRLNEDWGLGTYIANLPIVFADNLQIEDG